MSESLTYSGRYTFDFTTSGFTLVNKEGEPLYENVLPFFEKSVGHLIWIFFWLILILASHLFFPAAWLSYTDRTLMTLIFFHLFLFGCRLTTLLLKDGLKPILFPPLWVRLTRKLQKGEGIELLKKYDLHTHPGLLANLSLIQYSRGQYNEAHQTMHAALALSPNHPILSELCQIRNSVDSYPFKH